MSKAVVDFSKEELKQFLENKNSCVSVKNSVYNLALFPYHLSDFNASIKAILNIRIGKYEKKLDGILLGYKNIKLLSTEGTIVTDSCHIHVDIQADFYIFKPEVGCSLLGVVNKNSEDHVGCLVHRLFNISVPKPDDDEDWAGHLTEIGQEIILNVTYVDLESRLPYIRAKIDLDHFIPSKCSNIENDEVDNNDEQFTTPVSKKKKNTERSDLKISIDDNKIIDDSNKDNNIDESFNFSEKKKKRKRSKLDETETEISLKKKVLDDSFCLDNLVNGTIDESNDESNYKKHKKKKSKDSLEHNYVEIDTNETSFSKKKRKTKSKDKSDNNTPETYIELPSPEKLLKDYIAKTNSSITLEKIESDAIETEKSEEKIKKRKKDKSKSKWKDITSELIQIDTNEDSFVKKSKKHKSKDKVDNQSTETNIELPSPAKLLKDYLAKHSNTEGEFKELSPKLHKKKISLDKKYDVEINGSKNYVVKQESIIIETEQSKINKKKNSKNRKSIENNNESESIMDSTVRKKRKREYVSGQTQEELFKSPKTKKQKL